MEYLQVPALDSMRGGSGKKFPGPPSTVAKSLFWLQDQDPISITKAAVSPLCW